MNRNFQRSLFSTKPEPMVTQPTATLSEVKRPPKIKMADCKPEGSTMFLSKGMRFRRNVNGYPHIFDHVRINGDTADIFRPSNPKWRTINRRYNVSLERNDISSKFQQLPRNLKFSTTSARGSLTDY